MATRTSGTIDGSPNYKRVSVSLVDAQGDIRSVSLVIDAATLDSAIETYVAALQAASNASVYSVEVSEVYEGARATSNADDAVINSVYGNIVYHAKASPTSSQRGYIPAPKDTVFVAGTDTPDTADTLLTDFFSATLAVLGAGYTGQSVRYTERREINEAVKF